jgi:hypothetical protein
MLLASSAAPHAALSDDAFAKDKDRVVLFYDTADHYLYRNSYVFRERHEPGGAKRRVTLKFRHPDRCLAQDRDMGGADADSDDLKFEEDLKPVLRKLYSYSNQLKARRGKNINTLDDVADFFPDIVSRIDGWQRQREIECVHGFRAREIVLTGPTFALPSDTAATCALIVWYDFAAPDAPATVAELSFRFANEDEQAAPDGGYNGPVTDAATRLFIALQDGLGDGHWAERDLAGATTKTRFVFSGAGGARQ